jgi:AraC family transcriptional regulator
MTAHPGLVLDESNVTQAEAHDYTGAVVRHRRLSGADVSRIMHPPGQRIAAHGHDWPVLTLYRLGAYREESEAGAATFDGPSVVFQPAGSAHADEIGASGLETLAMTFDPAWLSPETRAALPRRSCWRPGGPLAAASRRLAQTWLAPHVSEAVVRQETSQFLYAVFGASAPSRPAWAEHVEGALRDETSTRAIAVRLSRHPAWLARAYRAWRGEGIAETLRRRRVERATLRLRASAAPLAEVAIESGFCDQSHMNRAFRAVLGRTPLEVRREAGLLALLRQSA